MKNMFGTLPSRYSQNEKVFIVSNPPPHPEDHRVTDL